MRRIFIGLLGAGNVSAGAIRILQENRDSIESRLAASVQVKRVLVRDPTRVRVVEIADSLMTTDPSVVLDDPEIRIVVELIGGLEPARTYVLEALRNGKHVVTANKALLACHGDEIFAEAARRGLSVYFEGSVAGGIPILRSLREGLASDRIEGITGIVNGTSNYILDAMTRHGVTYEQALAQAQEAGYAEADPSLDVGGKDAAHKLALLSLVSFGLRIDPEQIPTDGITNVRPFDIRIAGDLGYVIKSVARATLLAQGVFVGVYPVMVPKGHILAGVYGAYNAVLVESFALGRSLYYGRGAGMMPTGVAVVSDIIEVCRNIVTFAESGPPPASFRDVRRAVPLSEDHIEGENYLSVHVPNLPGMLGKVASCLGRHGVSVKSMYQDMPKRDDPVDMVIITERVENIRLVAAIADLDGFEEVLRPIIRIRMLEPGLPV